MIRINVTLTLVSETTAAVSIPYVSSLLIQNQEKTCNTKILLLEVIVNQSVEPQRANLSLLPETPILVI